MAENSAAGNQPGPLPIIDRSVRADLRHYKPGRSGSIEWIILHNTEGLDSLHWLSDNPNSAVSATCLISRDGVRHDLVDFMDTAWHVGVATPPITNDNSVGVEFENLSSFGGTNEPYTAAQMNTGAHWAAAVMFSYGRGWERVKRHGDVALPAGRRHDPSNFDMADFERRANAWLLFFGSLPENERAHYIQGAPLAAPAELSFLGPPTISPAVFERVLLARHSPILDEGSPASAYYNLLLHYGINPAIALAFTIHENGAGTQGVTAPLKNWGAVRTAQSAGLAAADSPVMTDLGPFAKYDSWYNALEDWCLRITGPKYLGAHPEWTVRQALQVYAPAGDQGNNPNAYADAVANMVRAWAAESAL